MSDDTSSFPGTSVEESAGFSPGDTFEAKYKLERILASGGMGVVLLATHKHLGHEVAVKLLHGGASETTRKRFLREARLAAKLDSPHVARVLDYGFSGDGTPYLVMELLVGRTLAKRMKAGSVPVDEALSLSTQLLSGLSAIHASGVVHRDLKPSNLFLCRQRDGSEILKIIDFGIAKRMKDDLEAAGDPSLTAGGEVVGTLRYMSPEQIRHSARVDARADLWSAGVVMYQLFTGRAPLMASSGPEMVAKVLGNEPIEEPVTLDRTLPLEVNLALCRCLVRDPAERAASAEEVLAMLPKARPLVIATELSAPASAEPKMRGRAILAALVVVGAGLLTLAIWPRPDRVDAPALEAGLTHGVVLPLVRARDEATPALGASSTKPAAVPATAAARAPTLAPSKRSPKPKMSGPKPLDPRFGDRH
ncbi:MAG: serine/threonine-protein kinase [Polyangiaceae bacterium]